MENLTLTETLLSHIPLAALFAVFAFALLRVFIDQQNKVQSTSQDVSAKFESVIDRVMQACQLTHNEMMKYLSDQDTRWRDSMNVRDEMYRKSIQDLEQSIDKLTSIIERMSSNVNKS